MTTTGSTVLQRFGIACFFLLTVAVMPGAEAQPSTRRRPVKLQTASLAGRVLDSVTGAAVFEAVIRVGNRTFTAGQDGRFSLEGLPAGNTSVSAERWGYQPASQQVSLRVGSNSVELRLAPKPVVVVTDTAGVVRRLDFESTEFVTQGPFAPYVVLSPAEFCRRDGTLLRVNKSEIARLVGPGRSVQNTTCCPRESGIELRLELESGESLDVILRECEFYRYDLRGRNRENGQFEYLGFRNVALVVFP